MRSYGRTHDKRRYLSLQLAFRDVYMDVLPQGMERAKRNKSFWDSKYGDLFVSIVTITHSYGTPKEANGIHHDRIHFSLAKIMKFTITIIASLAALAVANPTPDTEGITVRENILEPRKGCSGKRLESDECTGKKLQAQNAFHNWCVSLCPPPQTKQLPRYIPFPVTFHS